MVSKRLCSAAVALALLLSLFVIPTQAVDVPEERSWDLTAGVDALPKFEGDSGAYEGIHIDAQNGKFAPRDSDTQINSGTILSIPVAANDHGAVLTLALSGGSATVKVGDESYASANGSVVIPLEASEVDSSCAVTFAAQAFLTGISLTYSAAPEAYPGTPDGVTAVNTAWDLTRGATVLPTVQGERADYDGIRIDAQNGKFAPRAGDTQINGGTILYIPVAANANGAVLTISLSGNSTTVEVGGQEYTFSGSKDILLEASAADFYCAVSFQAESYLSSISLTYSAAPEAYPGTPDGVTAVDTAWDLTQGVTVLPAVQGERTDYAGIRIDASAGKFAPRDGDTQINGGTILYIPVAADPSGVVLTVTGNNYNNLTITLDGEPLKVGVETSLAAAQNGYLALSFSGEGSCYLTGITVDYLSDVPEVRPSTVTVGPDGACDYTSIQAALDANPSSQETPLTILIAPGTYTEKVTVQDPYVTFQALSGGDVVIQEQYYSSNRYDQNGVYWPVDEYDVGTATCGTVIVESTASNFSAVGITFRNTYNLTVATAAGEQTPAVALHTKADKVYLKDCTLEGRQDTLYVQGPGCRVYAEDCFIEGTVDFIFGDADAWFSSCTLHMAAFPGRDTGYFTAPNTKSGYTGLVFENCTLTVDDSYAKESGDTKVSLGRPWQNECWQILGTATDGSSYVVELDSTKPREGYENVSSAATFLGCTMDPLIRSSRWNLWSRKNSKGDTVDVTYHPTVRFAEYNSVDPSGAPLEIPASIITLGEMHQTDDLNAVTTDLWEKMRLDAWLPAAPEPPAVYAVTLDPVGGTVESSALYTQAGGVVPALPVPVREGFRFDGWFTAADGGVAVAEGAVLTADTTLYAHWTALPAEGPDDGGSGSGGSSTGGGSSSGGGSGGPSSGGSSGGASSSDDSSDGHSSSAADPALDVEIQPDDVPLASAPAFPDVTPDAWYAEAVAYVAESGIMNGSDNGAFAPDDRLSRAQLAQILYNLEGKPALESAPEAGFADVPSDAWYAGAVYWGKSFGILTGYSDTAFGPEDDITREQLAVMLYRYAQAEGLDVAGLETIDLDAAFADASQVSQYAYEAVCWCYMKGILEGSDGILNPGGTATRAQAAAMLMRFCQNTGL